MNFKNFPQQGNFITHFENKNNGKLFLTQFDEQQTRIIY